MLLAQKSKASAVGRKRKRHEIAALPGQADARMADEEVKQDTKDNDDSAGSPLKMSQNGEIDHADLEKTTDSSSYIRVNSISE